MWSAAMSSTLTATSSSRLTLYSSKTWSIQSRISGSASCCFPANDLASQPHDTERELTEFSYIVSHDLAAPCRHLSHFSQLLLRDMGGELTDSQRTYGSQIQAAGEKCQAMLGQLILFSRAQTCPLNCASHDAAYLARSALLQISQEVHQAEADVSSGTVGTVYGDDNLLTKVFQELILNAIKFRQPDRPCRARGLSEATDGRRVA